MPAAKLIALNVRGSENIPRIPSLSGTSKQQHAAANVSQGLLSLALCRRFTEIVWECSIPCTCMFKRGTPAHGLQCFALILPVPHQHLRPDTGSSLSDNCIFFRNPEAHQRWQGVTTKAIFILDSILILVKHSPVPCPALCTTFQMLSMSSVNHYISSEPLNHCPQTKSCQLDD